MSDARMAMTRLVLPIGNESPLRWDEPVRVVGRRRIRPWVTVVNGSNGRRVRVPRRLVHLSADGLTVENTLTRVTFGAPMFHDAMSRIGAVLRAEWRERVLAGTRGRVLPERLTRGAYLTAEVCRTLADGMLSGDYAETQRLSWELDGVLTSPVRADELRARVAAAKREPRPRLP